MTDTPNLDFRYDECSDLVHAAAGSHRDVGAALAAWLDKRLRLEAVARGAKTREDVLTQALCPGCYTLILIEALLALAAANRQSVRERCLYMAREFTRLADEALVTDNPKPIEGDKL